MTYFRVVIQCGEVRDGMRGLAGKLSYPDMENSPAKSTVSDALRDRDSELFHLFYVLPDSTFFSTFVGLSRKKELERGRKKIVVIIHCYIYLPNSCYLQKELSSAIM